MRRSSSSIPTNIAEGNVKKSMKERGHFFEISKASLEELHYQCFLSKDLQYISEKVFEELDDHIQRVSYILGKLRESLK
jgi:four helix bundle protein